MQYANDTFYNIMNCDKYDFNEKHFLNLKNLNF